MWREFTPPPPSDPSRQAEIFRFQINLPSDLSLGEFLPTFEPTTLPHSLDHIRAFIPRRAFTRFTISTIHRILGRFFPYKTICEWEDSALLEDFLNSRIPTKLLHKQLHFVGFFQNLRYFDHFHDELMRDFTLNSPLSKRNQALKQHILATPDSCFIHICRGDYLISPSFIELGSAYYENALLELKAHILSPHCFIFGNDIPWVQEHFIQSLSDRTRQGVTFEFIEGNDEGNAIEEMELMKSAQNAIIANSTFSWWAAYLIPRREKVIITPKRIFYDPNDLRVEMKNLIPTHNQNGIWICADHIWKGAKA